MGERVLLVDDAPETLEVLERHLVEAGYHVTTLTDPREALVRLAAEPVDVVITDLKMPRVSGLDVVRHVRENHKDTEVVVITGFPTVESALQAVRHGAGDFLAKPFTRQELLRAVGQACERLRTRRALRPPPPQEPPAVPGLVGACEPMRRVLAGVERAASSALPVLVTGEPGSGRELVARAIHYRSARAGRPFVPVHLSAIPPERLESELFGGGGVEGLVPAAAGGSILVDDVAAADPALQLKLLRLLEEGQVFPAGSRQGERVDVRVMAATHRDLSAMVQAGTFRQDLHYRLGGISLQVPPLRERGDDLLLLVRHFLERFSREANRRVPALTDQAVQVMRNHSWPGNVRELENTVQRLMFTVEDDVLDVPDLRGLLKPTPARARPALRSLSDVEAEHIRSVVDAVDGNLTHAAEILGIDRKTLREKMKRQGSDH